METTPSATGTHILSVGIVQTDGRGTRLADDIYWVCDPGVPVENTRYHGLTDADVTGQPPLADHLDDLAAILTATPGQPVVFVAHNAGSDLAALHLGHTRAARVLPDAPVLDTLALARHLRTGAGGYRLPQVLAHYGLTVTDHHNALADASDTATLLARLLGTAAATGHTDLAALRQAAQGERLRTGDYPAGQPVRGSRARRGSPFTLIEREATHQATHTSLPKHPTAADLDTWLTNLRDCVRLRCPLLIDKTRALHAPTRARALATTVTALLFCV